MSVSADCDLDRGRIARRPDTAIAARHGRTVSGNTMSESHAGYATVLAAGIIFAGGILPVRSAIAAARAP